MLKKGGGSCQQLLPDHRSNHRAGVYWGYEDETESQLLSLTDAQLEIVEAGS